MTATHAPRTAAVDVSAARVFFRTCAAEWSRLWTVRATWWFVAAAAVGMVGIGLIAGFESAADAPQGDPAWVVPSVAAMPSQFALLALALTAVTADYATGGIVPALQWTPRRGVFFLARTVVAVSVATALGVLLAVASAGAAYAAARPVLELPLDAGLDVLGTIALVFAAGTALAVGLGFLLRNTAGALVTVFLVMLVLPLFLPQFGYAWTSALAEVLPGSGAAFLLLGEVPGMTTASSVAILLVWAGGALLLGWLRLVRDDANR
jgi:ABC-2 type transport system permease protein